MKFVIPFSSHHCMLLPDSSSGRIHRAKWANQGLSATTTLFHPSHRFAKAGATRFPSFFVSLVPVATARCHPSRQLRTKRGLTRAMATTVWPRCFGPSGDDMYLLLAPATAETAAAVAVQYRCQR